MGSQLKPILIIVAILAVVGAAGYGLHQATQRPAPTETAEQGGSQTQSADQAETAEAAAGDEAPAKPPTFDIVRVEPSGEIVAAGQSSAGAHVWLMNEADAVAKAEANVDGEWAMVADEALPPGSYDLALRATGENGNGGPVEGDRATIVIEAPDETPLVAVTRPGEPTEVLQKPEPKASAEQETVVAAVAPDAERDDEPAAGDQPAAADQQPPPQDGDQQTAGSGNVQSGNTRTRQAAADQHTARQEPPKQEAATREPASQEVDTDQTGADQIETGDTEPGAEETRQAGTEREEQPASADMKTAAAAGEPDAEKSTATEDQSSSEEQQIAALSDDEISGDRTGSDAGDQAASREDTAADQETAAASQGEQDQKTQDSASAAPEPAAQDDRPVPDGDVTIETVEIEDPDSLMLGGQAEPGDAVRIYMNNERLDDVETDQDGRWTLSEKREMPPGRYTVRADVVDDEGDVTSRAEVKFDRVMTIAEEEAGGTDSVRTVNIVSRAGGAGAAASGGGAGGAGVGTAVVVIARGDNLWRIARKIYGRGIRHSVIYEANRNQIRNPHRIYPGQVFTIPVLEGENDQSG